MTYFQIYQANTVFYQSATLLRMNYIKQQGIASYHSKLWKTARQQGKVPRIAHLKKMKHF